MKPSFYTLLTQLETLVSNENPYWNIDRSTGHRLQDLIHTNNYSSVLEIGTSIGVSSLYMAEALEPQSGHITTVESHRERFTMAEAHFLKAGVTSMITQVLGHAPEILDTIEGTFDFMFFDATKYEHVSYIDHLKSRLSTGGMIVIDNIISHADDMQQCIDHITHLPEFDTHIENVGSGLLIAKKQ